MRRTVGSNSEGLRSVVWGLLLAASTATALLPGCGHQQSREAPPMRVVQSVPVLPTKRPSLRATSHYRAGLKFQKAKNYERASAELTKAVELASDFVDAHLALGRVWAARNEKEKATSEFGTVLKLAPGSKQSREAMEALQRLGAGSPSGSKSQSPVPPGLPSQATNAEEEGADPLASLVQQGRIAMTISAVGGSSGDVIRLKLQRKKPATLRASVAAGTVLRASDPAIQNMVVYRIRGVQVDEKRFRPAGIIVLDSDKPVTYVLEAYCLDFHKDNPSAKSKFALVRPDPDMARLLARVRESRADFRTIQAAIWMAHGIAPEEIPKRFAVDKAQLSAAHRLIQK